MFLCSALCIDDTFHLSLMDHENSVGDIDALPAAQTRRK